MRRPEFKLAVSFAAVVLAAAGAPAQFYGRAPQTGDAGPPGPDNVDIVQKLGTQVPTGLTFTDHNGNTVTLADAIGGKPTILVLHYNRCPKLCNEVIQGVITGLNDVRRADPAFVAGEKFSVVFVSIDPRDAPATAFKNRQLFHAQYDGRADDQAGVTFLTANHGQGTDLAAADRKVHELADAVGFKYTLRFRNTDYQYDAAAGEWKTADGKTLPERPRAYDYQHTSGVMVLTPGGTLSKYLLGLTYRPTDVRLALISASEGKLGTEVLDQIRQFCYSYDPKTGHYNIAMRLVAVAFTPFMLGVLFMAYRTLRSARAEAPPAVPAADPGPTTDHPREG